MATTPFEEPAPPTRTEQLQAFVGKAVTPITKPRSRMLLLLGIVALTTGLAPLPWSLIGILAIVALTATIFTQP